MVYLNLVWGFRSLHETPKISGGFTNFPWIFPKFSSLLSHFSGFILGFWRLHLSFVFLFVLRVLFVFWLDPSFYWGDSCAYLYMAYSFLGGRLAFLGDYGFGFSLILAFLSLFDSNLFVSPFFVCLFNSLVGGLCVYPLYFLALRADVKRPLASSLFASLAPCFLLYSLLPYSEVYFIFLLALSFLLVYFGFWGCFLAGFMGGLCQVFRVNGFLSLSLILSILLFYGFNFGFRSRRIYFYALAFLSGFLLVAGSYDLVRVFHGASMTLNPFSVKYVWVGHGFEVYGDGGFYSYFSRYGLIHAFNRIFRGFIIFVRVSFMAGGPLIFLGLLYLPFLRGRKITFIPPVLIWILALSWLCGAIPVEPRIFTPITPFMALYSIDFPSNPKVFGGIERLKWLKRFSRFFSFPLILFVLLLVYSVGWMDYMFDHFRGLDERSEIYLRAAEWILVSLPEDSVIYSNEFDYLWYYLALNNVVVKPIPYLVDESTLIEFLRSENVTHLILVDIQIWKCSYLADLFYGVESKSYLKLIYCSVKVLPNVRDPNQYRPIVEVFEVDRGKLSELC